MMQDYMFMAMADYRLVVKKHKHRIKTLGLENYKQCLVSTPATILNMPLRLLKQTVFGVLIHLFNWKNIPTSLSPERKGSYCAPELIFDSVHFLSFDTLLLFPCSLKTCLSQFDTTTWLHGMETSI